MEFKKYQHVSRLGTQDTEGILDGKVYIMPKIDGTNASLFMGEDGQVHAGSRKRELDDFKDNQGFYGNFHKDPRIVAYLEKHPTHRLFGEYLKPHSLKTYRDDAWDKFYVFDVCEDNGEDFKYIPYDGYKPLLEEFKIDYIPVLAVLENPTNDQIAKLAEENRFLIKEGMGSGEGIVCKRYDFVNKFGRIVWAKLIHNEFNNVRSKVKEKICIEGSVPIEKRIADKYLSKFVVDKEYQKIVNENPNIERKVLIPRLLNSVYYTLVTEEMWNVTKDFKNPVVNFKALQNESRNKVIQYKPDLFTKQN